MPLVPMPATVGIPWHRANQEQHGYHDEYSYPQLPCSQGLTSVVTMPFPYDTPYLVRCDEPRAAARRLPAVVS